MFDLLRFGTVQRAEEGVVHHTAVVGMHQFEKRRVCWRKRGRVSAEDVMGLQ